MKIFCIDSTTYVARISITEDNHVLEEVSYPIGINDWDKMESGDASFFVEYLLSLIDTLFLNSKHVWEDIDYICYSGYSGYTVSISLGKMLAYTLGRTYSKEVIPIDHITAHYFSLFVNQDDEHVFPKLIFSASGSHNSIVYMKDRDDLFILNDYTYYSENEKRYIGLGTIYNRLLLSLDILKSNQSPQEISKVLSELTFNVDEDLLKRFSRLYKKDHLCDLDMHNYYRNCKRLMKEISETYDKGTLFFSFEQSLFESLCSSFDVMLEIMKVKELSIVGGISHNDNFIDFLEKRYSDLGISVSRPLEDFRFDNASMLGVLAFYMKKNNIFYPFSDIKS